MISKSLFTSNKDDWETPAQLFQELNAEFHFQLDPCCTPETAQCMRFFTPEDDGLAQEWRGPVFMNPPYGRDIKHWMRKAVEAADDHETVVCLVPARTDTRWWHDYVMLADEIRFCNRRLTFEGAGNKATFPCAIVIYRGAPLGLRPKLGVQHV